MEQFAGNASPPEEVNESHGMGSSNEPSSDSFSPSLPSLEVTGPTRQGSLATTSFQPTDPFHNANELSKVRQRLAGLTLASDAKSNDVSLDSPISSPRTPPLVLPDLPQQLLDGVPMIKVTSNKIKPRKFKLTQTGSAIVWDSRKVGVAEVCQIREIRLGAALPEYLESRLISAADATRWISIVYVQPPSQWKVLHMIALSDESFHLWVSTLRNLLDEIKTMAGPSSTAASDANIISITGDKAARDGQDRAIHWARRFWSAGSSAADDSAACPKDPNRQLQFNDVLNLCKKAGLGCTEAEVKQIFQSVDTHKKGSLTFAEFRDFVQTLKSRTDVDELFHSLAPSGIMDAEAFTDFLLRHQGARSNDPRNTKWFNKYSKLSRTQEGMTSGEFAAFLTSPENSIVVDEDEVVGHDMTRPLHDYYISSSHNTYLIGGQWRGDSTVEGYVRALLAGCRTVEIDCWDGDHEPVVYHGNTLTSSVSVRDVCKAIAKYGFLASPYPIIISAEVHCCTEQQDSLAKILRTQFGDTLIAAELPGLAAVLPSPEQLKGKILFKTKQSDPASVARAASMPVFDYASMSESTESDVDFASARARSPSLVGRLSRRLSATKRIVATKILPDGDTITPVTPNTAPLASPPLMSPSLQRPLHRRASSSSLSKSRASPDLMALLVYTSGTKFRGFSKIAPYDFNDMFSLGEKTASKIIKTAHEDLIKHNRSHLTRVYPKGTRVTSSNYEPTIFWRVGCQLVAINWQTADTGFKLNFAMFSRNGRCGYVLKPEYLRVKPKETSETVNAYRLTVEVISGQQLPTKMGSQSNDDEPWVNLSLYLPPTLTESNPATTPASASSARNQNLNFRTRKIKGNTFNPRWGEKTVFAFTSLPSLLELTFLDLELRNGDDDAERGHWCGSLGGMRQGFRHVPLYDQLYSQYLYSTLFIRTRLEQA